MTAPTTTSVSRHGRVMRVEATATGCRVVLEGADGADPWEFEIPCAPRHDLAHGWAAQVRRVDSVVIDATDGTARASGLGRRLPFRRQVPVSVALALAGGGTPTLMVGVRR